MLPVYRYYNSYISNKCQINFSPVKCQCRASIIWQIYSKTFIIFIWGIHANSDLKGLIMNFLIINVSWQPSWKWFCCHLLLVSSLRICKGQESLNLKWWQKDSDTAVTSHMYEGQKWLALSRRLIAEHMSTKFKRRGYLEHTAFFLNAFCDGNLSYHSNTECIDQPLWTYNNWWL